MRSTPTPELAAFCITQSPRFSSTYCVSMRWAVATLTFSIAAWARSASCGRRTKVSALSRMRCVQLVRPRLITLSPTARPVTPLPIAATVPAPSMPRAHGVSGTVAYLPSIIRISAGLIEQATTSTSTSPAPGAPGSGTSMQRTVFSAGPMALSSAVFIIRNKGRMCVEQHEDTAIPDPENATPRSLSRSGRLVAWASRP